MKVQILCLPDRQYQLACTEPIEKELEARGHTVVRSPEPLDDTTIDATLATTYLYLKKNFRHKIKHPVFFTEHGVAVVKDGFRPLYHTKADHMMQSGPMWHERAQFLSPKYPGNLIVGYPKSDEIFNSIPDRDKIRAEVIQELSLDPNEPIILFAPTWYSTDCYNPGSTNLLDDIGSLGYKNLVTLFHDFDQIGKTLKGPRYIKSHNKNKYLIAADLMIGDYSSIVIEFAIMNRPIIQLKSDSSMEYFNIWREKDYGIFQIGDIVDKDGIKKAVDKAFDNPDEYDFLRKYWVEQSFYNPGKASKVAADMMEAIIK